jgi:hypothetical protein
MLRVSVENCGAHRATGRRLICDFSAMRGARIKYVKIRSLDSLQPGNSLAPARDLSRAACVRNLIKLNLIGKMRGASTKFDLSRTGWRVLGRKTTLGIKSAFRPLCRAPRAVSIRASAGSVPDFFLLYLTGIRFFDNRHRLLKKFDSARTAKTQLAVKPRN